MAGAKDKETRAEPATADREIVISRVIDSPAGAGVRGVHRGPAPVAVVGSGGVSPPPRGPSSSREGPEPGDFVMQRGRTGPTTPSGSPGPRSSHRSGSRCCTGESRDDPNAFESTLAFTPHGTATRIVMRTVFPTKTTPRTRPVEEYHAIEGGEQTLSNLAAYGPPRSPRRKEEST